MDGLTHSQHLVKVSKPNKEHWTQSGVQSESPTATTLNIHQEQNPNII